MGPMKFTVEKTNLDASLRLKDDAGKVLGAVHVALEYASPPGETREERAERHMALVEAVKEALVRPAASSTDVEGLREACKPWEFHVGEPPDDDSPLSCVFGAGISYTEQHLAELLGVKRYEAGDGSEDFRADAGKTLMNILAAAGLYDEEDGKFAALTPAARPAPEGSGDLVQERDDAVANYWRVKAKLDEVVAAVKSDLPPIESVLADAVSWKAEALSLRQIVAALAPSAPEPDEGSALREAPSVAAMQAAVELEIEATIGRVTTRSIGALIDQIVADQVAALARSASPPVQPRAEGSDLSQAARDVLAERRRQVEVEGWTPEHDDAHARSEIGFAAAAYAIHASNFCEAPPEIYQAGEPEDLHGGDHGVPLWDWDLSWWKPSDPRRDLVKAGALILAGIERLDRAPPPLPASGEVA